MKADKRLIISLIISTIPILVQAQIIHVDLAPNYFVETVSNGSDNINNQQSFDLNGDQVSDYYFNLRYINEPGATFATMATTSENDIIGEVWSEYDIRASMLYVNYSLFWGSGWTYDENRWLLFSELTPWFANTGDQYVGVKFDINGSYHYGWIRVNVEFTTSALSVTIKEYAYVNTSGVPLFVGDIGSTSIQSFNPKEVELEVFPNPATDFINIPVSIKGVSKVKIYDLQGKLVLTSTDCCSTGENLRLDVSDLNSGLYSGLLQMDDSFIRFRFQRLF